MTTGNEAFYSTYTRNYQNSSQEKKLKAVDVTFAPRGLKQFETDISKFKIEGERNSTYGLAVMNVEAPSKG
jgi:hypothetical protein